MHRIAVLLFLVLAACATPLEQCRREATRDLRVVEDLIAETRLNLQRGYALRQEVEPTVRVRFCTGRHDGWLFCNEHGTRVVERPVAIDLAAERRKLASLEEQRLVLRRRAERDLAACAARYPEG